MMRASKKMKGISPLIAAVLLIAFTMAIAGIMATWATTFSQQRLTSSDTEADCIGALQLSSLSFDNGTVNLKVRNVNEVLNMTDMRATLEYSDVSNNREYVLAEYNTTDNLPPASTAFVNIPTGISARPDKIEIVAINCPRHPGALFFR